MPDLLHSPHYYTHSTYFTHSTLFTTPLLTTRREFFNGNTFIGKLHIIDRQVAE